MAVGTINPDQTLIPDFAEVWLKLASDVTDITTMIPTSVTQDLAALGWEYTGLINDKKGIPLGPKIDVKVFDAFGHPKYRKKLMNGDMESGFTALERNAVTNKVVLPGSAPNRMGLPKNIQVYVLYKVIDLDVPSGQMILVSLTKAPIEVKDMSGFMYGEEFWAELSVHHTSDANNDVYAIVNAADDDVTKTFTIGSGVTAYTVTAGANTTPSITTLTGAALQTALRALNSVKALPPPGATVTPSGSGGPFAVVFTAPITPVSASGTGGTVGVA